MMVEKGVLPLLKKVKMIRLPKLKGIYKGKVTFNWPFLEEMTVRRCPTLRRLPLGFQSAPNLKMFHRDASEWFDQLEWED